MSTLGTLFDSLTLAQSVQPWFTNSGVIGGWIGASIGVFGGVFGAACGMLAPQGKARWLVMTMFWVGVAAGLSMLILSVIAILSSQPRSVWYGLGLPGLVLTAVFLPLGRVIRQRYEEAEQRRLEAEQFRSG